MILTENVNRRGERERERVVWYNTSSKAGGGRKRVYLVGGIREREGRRERGESEREGNREVSTCERFPSVFRPVSFSSLSLSLSSFLLSSSCSIHLSLARTSSHLWSFLFSWPLLSSTPHDFYLFILPPPPTSPSPPLSPSSRLQHASTPSIPSILLL